MNENKLTDIDRVKIPSSSDILQASEKVCEIIPSKADGKVFVAEFRKRVAMLQLYVKDFTDAYILCVADLSLETLKLRRELKESLITIKALELFARRIGLTEFEEDLKAARKLLQEKGM